MGYRIASPHGPGWRVPCLETTSLPERLHETCPGMYFTGDGCIRADDDGYYWMHGPCDDANVLATASAQPRLKVRS